MSFIPSDNKSSLTSDDSTDKRLLLMARNGACDAEEALVIRYTRLVRAVSRPFFLVGGDGEDLIQEGMLGLLNAIREFDPTKNVSFHTYAEVCIKNRIYSVLRSANRDKHAPLNDYLSLDPPYPVSQINSIFDFGTSGSHSSDPEELVIGREAFDELSHTLKKLLSAFEAEVLVYYLDGYSYTEIAERLGKTQKSVDNAVQRMRRKIHNLTKASAGNPAEHKRPM